ncbi:MAG: DUF624 domain-containing protein [Ruminococcaceae bacterium]|nr:DUF624 domain-containing protein [Oscillospiraceae bacterium]
MAEKRKRFRLFNYSLDGKGVPKDVDEPRNFKFYFKLLGRNLSRLMSVNMLIVFSNFPIFFVLFGLSGNLNTTSYSPVSSLFGPIYGAMKISGETSPLTSAINGVHALQVEISVPTTATYVMYALGLLVLFTFGFSMVGTTYIVRNIVKGEPIFLMHDFKYAIKKNWRQGLIFGIIDLGLCVLIFYDIIFLWANASLGYVNSLMFYIALVIAIIYFVMRYYIYIMMITFDLSIYKLLKNAFIFSLVGFKRNFLGTAGIIILALFSYSLLMVFPPLGAVLPFVITIAIGQFTAIYTAWPKIYSIMIEPYEEEDTTPKEEAIFVDRG